jgi:hypothetical protein
MCKVKILLFEKSQRSGFPQASADSCASQENNLLCGGLDCLPFARSFVERRTQRARSFSTSEFESSQAAVSHIATLPQVSTQCELPSHIATLILAAMIAVRSAVNSRSK